MGTFYDSAKMTYLSSVQKQEGASLSKTASYYWQLIDSLDHLGEGNFGLQNSRGRSDLTSELIPVTSITLISLYILLFYGL